MQGIRKTGLYRLGSRIGTVAVQGDKWMFTCLDAGGVIYSESVSYEPLYMGRTWSEVSMRLTSPDNPITRADVLKDIEELMEFFEDALEEQYEKLTKRYEKWVRYSPRYDEVITDWEHYDLVTLCRFLAVHTDTTVPVSLKGFESYSFVINNFPIATVAPELFLECSRILGKKVTNYREVAYVQAALALCIAAAKQLAEGQYDFEEEDLPIDSEG